MKKLLKIDPLYYLIGIVSLADIIFLLVGIFAKAYDTLFIAMIVILLLILLIINTRSSSIYKQTRNATKDNIEIIKAKKAKQKWYWLLALIQIIIFAAEYIIITNM